MWISLDIRWNRWAVLHRRRSGGEVDLLERSLVIKVGPWIRSGDSPLPMEIFGGKSRPNLIWLSGIFSILLYIHLLTFYLFFWSIFLKLIFCRLVLDQSRVDKFWFVEKELGLEINPQSVSDALFCKSFLVTIRPAAQKTAAAVDTIWTWLTVFPEAAETMKSCGTFVFRRTLMIFIFWKENFDNIYILEREF